MRKYFIGAGFLFVTSTAWAKPPGVAFSAERIWGISLSTQSFEGGRDDQTTTSVGIGGSPLGQGGVYSAPRLGVDYVASWGFSAGGAIGVQSVKVEDFDSTTAVLLAPRLGYFVILGSRFALWPRAGITHWSVSNDDDDLSYTALSSELGLGWFVVDSAALFIMPHIDMGVAGGTDNSDSKITEIGLHFGMAAFL